MFEGSEKKLEITFSPKSPSLFKQQTSFWEKLVKTCGAELISYKKFPHIHSFILSESSLFVFKHRLILITCGQTALCKSLIKILKTYPKKAIELCFFQRKNEFFPQKQKSCFNKDLKNIQKHIAGKAYRFGTLHDHHFFLFHNNNSFCAPKKDQTLEILIYDSEFIKNDSPKTILKLKKKLAKVFLGFKIQDHFFKPFGYSLNAVKDEFYYTLHITPQKPCFYISFETNFKHKTCQTLTREILNIFKPLKFDFIFFTTQKKKQVFKSRDYFSSSNFYQLLDCGYSVFYNNFHKKTTKELSPLLIKKAP